MVRLKIHIVLHEFPEVPSFGTITRECVFYSSRILFLQLRDVEVEAEAGSGTLSVEAVALICYRFRFNSDQGFPTEGKFFTRKEFHKLGVCFKCNRGKGLG